MNSDPLLTQRSTNEQNSAHWLARHPWMALTLVNICLICLVDLVSCQIFFALGWYTPYGKTDTFYRQEHELYHHSLRPMVSYDQARWGSRHYTVHTNSLGFKDTSAREITLVPDYPRILIIGDSFVEGVGYSYEDTFFGHLREIFQSEEIEFLNAGVSSYSPIIYWKKVETLLAQGLRFDHLLVFVDVSDAADEKLRYTLSSKGTVLSAQEKGGLSQVKRQLETVRDWITSHSVILGELRRVARNRKLQKREDNVSWDDALNDERSSWTFSEELYRKFGKEGLALGASHMKKLLLLLRAKSIPMTLVVYPWPDQIFHSDLDSKQVEFWESWCITNNVAFLNLFPPFFSGGHPEEIIKERFITGDVHWNEQGHRLVAEHLADYLRSKSFEMRQ